MGPEGIEPSTRGLKVRLDAGTGPASSRSGSLYVRGETAGCYRVAVNVAVRELLARRAPTNPLLLRPTKTHTHLILIKNLRFCHRLHEPHIGLHHRVRKIANVSNTLP